ncbi:hypothetical protein ACEWY4_023333 [Coilia grayii]|uniref:Ropporin-1-like protein n=1 Tax=Coilia grayii TaxID=363190 RepID=A0ABD1J593_9TELE
MSQSRHDDDVFIPDTLPEFLKHYTKAVIRTQPEDLLQWSHKYFTAMVKGQPLPVCQPSDHHTLHAVRNLTPEILRELHSQFNGQRLVSQGAIMLTWKSLNLAENCLTAAFTLGRFGEQVEWMKFFTLCCNYLGGNIRQALVQACHILNSDPQCPDACVSFSLFKCLYLYLAYVTNKLTLQQAEETLSLLQQKTGNGVVRVSDFISDYKLILDPNHVVLALEPDPPQRSTPALWACASSHRWTCWAARCQEVTLFLIAAQPHVVSMATQAQSVQLSSVELQTASQETRGPSEHGLLAGHSRDGSRPVSSCLPMA